VVVWWLAPATIVFFWREHFFRPAEKKTYK
jgi:hypothetical protein